MVSKRPYLFIAWKYCRRGWNDRFDYCNELNFREVVWVAVTHEMAKKFINRVGMGLTCIIVIYGLIQISNNWLTKAFMVVFGIFVEIETQYIWGLSFTYKKNNQGARAGWLKAACVGYVLMGILLAVGFFAMEIDKSNIKTMTVQQNNWQRKLDQANRRIDTLQKQAENETDKFGPKAKEIENLIKEAIKNRDVIEQTPTPQISNNIFTALANILKPVGISEWILKLFIFGYCVFMIYLGVMLTYWNIEIETTDNASNTSENDQSKKTVIKPVQTHMTKEKSAVTNDVTTGETGQTVYCECGCGKTFIPPKNNPGKLYYDDNCRIRAYRAKIARMKKEGVKVL